MILRMFGVLQITFWLIFCVSLKANTPRANINGREYYFSTSTGGFQDAITYCNDMGMDLLALETSEESTAVTAYIRDILQTADTTYLTSGLRIGRDWMWSSSDLKISYANWSIGFPYLNDTVSNVQGCIWLLNGQIQDNECNQVGLNFICEQRDCPPCTNNTGIHSKELVDINGRRYYFSSTRASYGNAMMSCREIGLKLASLETPEESDAIFTYISDVLHINQYYYRTSGLRMAEDWLWLASGENFTYAFWMENYPQVAFPNELTCVETYYSGMGNYDCDSDDRFICEQMECPPCL